MYLCEILKIDINFIMLILCLKEACSYITNIVLVRLDNSSHKFESSS